MLELVQLAFEINLFLSQEFEFKVPEARLSKLVGKLSFLSLLPHSIRIIYELNLRHFCTIIGSWRKDFDPGEASFGTFFRVARCQLSAQFLSARACE